MLTSCFSRVKLLTSPLVPVSISRGTPPWFTGKREIRLAPERTWLSLPRSQYDRLYMERLAGLDPKEIFEKLGDNAVLLCWESPGEWCHRRAVAEWLEQALGVEVSEFGFGRGEVLPYLDMPASPPKPSRWKK